MKMFLNGFLFPRVDTQPATLIQRCFDVDFGRVSHLCTEVNFHLTFHSPLWRYFRVRRTASFSWNSLPSAAKFCSLTAENFRENDVICEKIVTSSGWKINWKSSFKTHRLFDKRFQVSFVSRVFRFFSDMCWRRVFYPKWMEMRLVSTICLLLVTLPHSHRCFLKIKMAFVRDTKDGLRYTKLHGSRVYHDI